MVFDPKTFKPLPEPQQARVVPVPVSSLDQAKENRLRSSPLPMPPETFKDAPRVMLEKYGYPAGQVTSRGRFVPLKGVPLGPKEQDIKLKAQQTIDAATQTAEELQRAFKLNDQAYSGGFPQFRLFMGRTIGSTDPTYLASQELDGLMNNLALSQLKTSFPGSVTEGEREFLVKLQGSVSLPRDVRFRYYANAIPRLKNIIERNNNIIKQVDTGTYFTRNPSAFAKRPPSSSK